MRFSKEKKRELIQKLREIFDDDEFILGVLCDLRSDSDIDIILEYIERTENAASEDIILLSMQIADLEDNFDDFIVDDFSILQNNCEEKK